MIVSDYRNTKSKNHVFELKAKKKDFIVKFKSFHPRTQNVYENVKSQGSDINRIFREMYFHKCIYCGVSNDVIDSSSFEVDHFIPQTVLKDSDLKYEANFINGIDNLVNSCKFCNRSKSGFICADESHEYIHPDENKLHEIYFRKEDFSIGILPEYFDDKVVNEFYQALKLDNELRRLDYLIMELKAFVTENEDNPDIKDVYKAILEIEQKRRSKY